MFLCCFHHSILKPCKILRICTVLIKAILFLMWTLASAGVFVTGLDRVLLLAPEPRVFLQSLDHPHCVTAGSPLALFWTAPVNYLQIKPLHSSSDWGPLLNGRMEADSALDLLLSTLQSPPAPPLHPLYPWTPPSAIPPGAQHVAIP